MRDARGAHRLTIRGITRPEGSGVEGERKGGGRCRMDGVAVVGKPHAAVGA